jgi:2-keto-4-pentenoate hydratase/2-oxohepta-3-ene-1,7-dioic acid hydratase in catechol pathway
MKIICIGRNYVLHAKEFGNEIPFTPVFFLKPETSLLLKNRPFFYPEFSEEIQFETELVVRIDKVGKNIEEKFAHTYYNEISLGIDFTARDIQRLAKTKGLPWEKAKAFDNSAVLGKFLPKTRFQDMNNINFHLDINGKQAQKGNSGNMTFGIDYLISYISKYLTLKMGDLIYTGTPEGVGPVSIGDQLTGYIEEEEIFHCDIK